MEHISLEHTFVFFLLILCFPLQILVSQNEMQEGLFSLVDHSVEEEGQRVEGALAAEIERISKSNADALFARFVEETAGQENPMRDLQQQLENVLTSLITKNLGPTMWKAMMPSPEALHALTSPLEEAVSSSFTQSLVRILLFNKPIPFLVVWI